MPQRTTAPCRLFTPTWATVQQRVFLVLALVLIPGCAAFHPQPLSPSHTVAAFTARTLDNPDLKSFLEKNLQHEVVPWPPQSWDFALLTLVALYYHPDLDTARAAWEVAAAGVMTAAARPNPTVKIAAGDTANAEPGLSSWLLNTPLDIPLETAGKRGYRIAQATHLSEAARLNLATTAWQVRSRLRKSLLDLYAATQTETLLDSQQAVGEEIVTVMEQRLAAGETAQPEVTLVRIALDQTRLAVRDAQKQRAEAQVHLADALGVSVDALRGVALSFALFDHLPPQLPAQEVQRQVLLHRSDILGALAAYTARESALQLEIAKQYPDIHFPPSYERDTGENKWFLGLSLVMPVLNRNEGPIAEAEARRKEAAARFGALQARVIGEIDRALAGYRAALQKLETADSLLSAHKKQQESTQAMFQVGEADRLTLLNTQLELAVSTLARWNALVTAQQSFGLLEDAVQHPLHPLGSLPVVPERNPRLREEGRE